MTRFLTTPLIWLLKKLKVDIIAVDAEVTRRANDLTPYILDLENSALPGEGKRHQVYARALKLYPGVEAYVIGLALEIAVSRIRRGV